MRPLPPAVQPKRPVPRADTNADADFQWLTDDEQVSWRAYLRASRALELTLDSELQVAGMSLAEYELLSMLSETEDDSMRMSQLADLVIQSRSRVTHTATRLQRRGWVRRQSTLDDGRGIELVLTEEGLAAVEAAARIHVQGVREHLIDQMDPSLFHSLGAAMMRVREHRTGHYRP